MSGGANWLEENLDLAAAFCSLAEGRRRFVYLCFAEETLDDRDHVARLVADYAKIACEGYLLWISDLVEPRITPARLKAYRDLCQGLASDGRQVINVHGGFLAGTLVHWGLIGFGHGIGYGEHRDVTPILGGGLPPEKYYFPPLHQKLHAAEVQTLFPGIGVGTADDFHVKVCGCPICTGVLKGELSNFEEFGEYARGPRSPYPTSACMKKCKFHYLLARKEELDYLERTALDGIMDDLREASEHYESQAILPSVRYLRIWADGLA
jgi:hypothetical protein